MRFGSAKSIMYILLAVVLFVVCGWIPIICGSSSYAVPFIGGLCGIIIALGFYLSSKLSEVKKNQEEILRRLDEQKEDKNEIKENK